MSTGQPSEEELRAAYEEQIKQVQVQHVLLDNVVMIINLGMRRTGLMPGTESERDVGQVQLAIESVRALMPMLEAAVPEQAKQIREALSQLQMAYVQLGGPQPAGERTEAPVSGAAASETGPDASEDAPGPQAPPEPGEPGQPGPAQRSGRLWIPGQ